MAIDNDKKLSFITEFIKQSIESELEKVISEEIELAKKRIDERKSQIIAGVIITLYKELLLEQVGQKLIITVLSK